MNNHSGFSAVATLLVVLGVIVVGGATYMALNPQESAEKSEEGETRADDKSSISWNITAAGEVDGIPRTNVTAVVNGTSYDAGTFMGSCAELSGGGVDGNGLLVGELSAVQCWYAGSGDEIGVFAHEDGGFDILVGELSEGEEGTGLFRGNFTGKYTIPL